MAIKIEMLRCFEAVVRSGSLADAAVSLGRTASAVSMMLKQFEEHVGAPLFETTRKSRLTRLGEMIYAEAAREVRHFVGAVAVIEGLSRSTMGYIRIAVTPSVASLFLPSIVKDFLRSHDGVQIDIRDMDSESIAASLRNEKAEIGIGTLPEIGGFTRAHLFSDNFGVLCRHDHPIAKLGRPVGWADVAGNVLIANGLSKSIKDRGFQKILSESRLMVRNVASTSGLVRAGLGISIMPRLAVPENDVDLAFVPLRDTNVARQVFMVTRPQHVLTPAARAMTDQIVRARPVMHADSAT